MDALFVLSSLLNLLTSTELNAADIVKAVRQIDTKLTMSLPVEADAPNVVGVLARICASFERLLCEK